MNSYIRKLQSKGEAERKQVLITSLVVSMAIVGSIWIYSLSDRIETHKEVAAEEENETVKPFTLFANSVSNTYKNISASVGNFSGPKDRDMTDQKQVDLIIVEQPVTE